MSAVKVTGEPKIDLEDVLHGQPAWEDVVEFFEKGDFCAGNYEVKAIKRWLLTAEQKQLLVDNDLSIYDVLSGNYGEATEDVVFELQSEWNRRLGSHVYLSGADPSGVAPDQAGAGAGANQRDDDAFFFGIFQEESQRQLDNLNKVLSEDKLLDLYSNALGIDLRSVLGDMQTRLEGGKNALDKLVDDANEEA